MDRDLRDWLRSLAVRRDPGHDRQPELSDEAADYLAHIAPTGLWPRHSPRSPRPNLNLPADRSA